MLRFDHNYPFDPCYGFTLQDLLAVPAPNEPDDFANFWQQRYQQCLTYTPDFTLTACGRYAGFLVYDLSYRADAEVIINGWLLVPENQTIKQGIVVGHGYGGRDQPDYHLRIPETAFLFPCFRGLGRSRQDFVSDNPSLHVLNGIDDPWHYILGGCVEDLWQGVSVLLQLYPHLSGHIGYMGISFGGGIGALALPWDERIQRAHFNVPTFGNQALRMKLPTIGSAAAVQNYAKQHDHILETLKYYDAASAARHACQPAHFAVALFDPVVAAPGQFAIYNAWAGRKSLFVLEAGHFEYPNHAYQEQLLLDELTEFFGEISP